MYIRYLVLPFLLPLSLWHSYLLKSQSPLLKSLLHPRVNYMLLQGFPWYHQYIFGFLALVLGMLQVGLWVILRCGCVGLVIFVVLEIYHFCEGLGYHHYNHTQLLWWYNPWEHHRVCFGNICCLMLPPDYVFILCKESPCNGLLPRYGYIIIFFSIHHMLCAKAEKLLSKF